MLDSLLSDLRLALTPGCFSLSNSFENEPPRVMLELGCGDGGGGGVADGWTRGLHSIASQREAREQCV